MLIRMDSPFTRDSSPRLPDIVTDGAVHLIGSAGVDRFSIRSIARWMRVTPSRLLDVYSRARLLEIIAIEFGNRWLEWTLADEEGSLLRLPESPDERLGVCVRTALEQLAESERHRGKPEPSNQFDYLDNQERAHLEMRMRGLSPTCCPPDDHEVRAAMAVIAGLRVAVAHDPARLDLEVARRVLSGLARSSRDHRRDCDGVALAS
jgi:hypothetical protein